MVADEAQGELSSSAEPSEFGPNPFRNAAYDALAPVFKKAPRVETIYHYTDARGLKGLVDDRVIWLSDVAFMNDASETSYALDLCEDELGKYVSKAPQGEKDTASVLMQRLREVRGQWRQVAFCTSTAPNLLTQWRDYARESVSYSVGLNVDALRNATHPSFPIKMSRMIYDEKTQRQVLRKVFKRIRDIARPIVRARNRTTEQLDQTVGWAAVELHTVLDWFKNPGFESEKEVRVFQEITVAMNAGAGPLTRTSRLGIVPYFSWSMGPGLHLPISHIVVGPSPYGPMGEAAVRIMCDIAGLKDVNVQHSTIPWRR